MNSADSNISAAQENTQSTAHSRANDTADNHAHGGANYHTHDGVHYHTHGDEGHHSNHSHTHNPDEIRAIVNRLKRSVGHLDKVRRMVENGDDCSDVLIQLSAVKSEINNLSNLVKVQKMRESRGMKAFNVSYHCVFTGNPGTGKTTVARIVAEIYKELGVIKKGHLVETDRSGLVAEYVGQTAPKTNAIIDSALDGILFIDEAYSLVQSGQNDFGKEAVAALLKRMEDDRDRLVVILAGYSKEMKDFIGSNSGLQSRFNRYIDFPDYNTDELMRIFEYIVKKNDFTVSKEALAKVKEIIQEEVAHKDDKFRNARFIRNLFEKIITEQANRLSTESNITNDKLNKIEEIDIIAVLGYYFRKDLYQQRDAKNQEPEDNTIKPESLWDFSLKHWASQGWQYEDYNDGFIIRFADDNNIRIDAGFYKGHYYIQARYKEDYDFAYLIRGLIYEKMGDKSRAIQDIRKAKELDPYDQRINEHYNRLK